MLQNIGRPEIFSTEDIEQDIAQAKQVQGEGTFG
jgi:hypothetical protein